ncbi:hypothetical protein ACFVYP_15575 [Kitasatospora sp. NPDC058201]|uniref:hypothetical protein n=1 Tax=unclassified Kitasatospora TaxID=2633591 RepID=UPI00364F8FBC
MNPEELLALIRRHWAAIRADLDDTQHGVLVARLNKLAGTRGDERAIRRAFHGVKLALLPLPLDHPVRAALDSSRLVAADPRPTASLARELLAWLAETDAASAFTESALGLPSPDSGPDSDSGPGPGPGPGRDHGPVHGPPPHAAPHAAPDTAEIIATAQRRLLAEPSLGRADLDARGLDAPALAGAGLIIRLIDQAGEHRYPAFQFAGPAPGAEPGTGRGPLPVVTRINRLLLAEADPWGAADWWLAGNSWLGGTPAALLGLVSDELLTAAALSMVEGD